MGGLVLARARGGAVDADPICFHLAYQFSSALGGVRPAAGGSRGRDELGSPSQVRFEHHLSGGASYQHRRFRSLSFHFHESSQSFCLRRGGGLKERRRIISTGVALSFCGGTASVPGFWG